MDTLTLLTTLASLAAILGLLYLMVIGQKSLPEWWREKHPLAIQGSSGNAQSPQVIPMRPTPPKRRLVFFGGHPFTNLRKLRKARQLYEQAGVEAHPEFDGLLKHTLLQVPIRLLLLIGIVLFIAYVAIPYAPPMVKSWIMGTTSIRTNPPAAGNYKIIVVSGGTIHVVECNGEMQLTSNEPIRLRISSNEAGEPKWHSLAQDKFISESIFDYTPGIFIGGEFDVISYYSDGVLQCSLRLLRANSP